MPSVTIHCQRSEPAWSQFWKEGREFHREFSNQTRHKASLFKPGTVLRYLLFEKAVALLVAVIVRECGAGAPIDTGGIGSLSLSLVFDREIEDPEGQATLEEAFGHWEKTSRLRDRLGIAPKVRVEFATEQEEPLLLLPDFIAGALHVRSLSAKGERLDFPAQLIGAAKDPELALSPIFVESEEPFCHKYPLGLEDGRVVLRNRLG